MKKIVLIGLLVCLLMLCACGAPAEEATPVEQVKTEEAPAVKPETPVQEPAKEAPVKEESVKEEPAEQKAEEKPETPAEPAGPTVEDALAFVEKPVQELKDAIGEPLESYYEYSCSGPGDDGILTYDGFIVFTYREPDGVTEKVVDAEAE